MKSQWIRFILPIGLGLAGIAFLIRVSVNDRVVLLPNDVDVLIIILGLSLAIFILVSLIVRETLERLRQQSVEQARQQAFAEHRRFLNRLDHELKNPLTSIQAGLGSLSLIVTDKQHQQLVQTIDGQTKRLSELVTNLRKLAELESLPIDTQPIDTQAFFAEVVALEQDWIEAGTRQFSLEPPSVWPNLTGDHDLLLLVLHNLMNNALKYTQPGDHITLRIRVENNDLVIQVQDTGIGIDAAEISLVWEELYRSRQVSGIPGTGIGLALVKAIVEQHDGDVHIASQPGVGTSVTLYLPLPEMSKL